MANIASIPNIPGSTETIMRVLYESLIPLEKVRVKADVVLLILDSQAQTTYNKLPKVTDLQNVTERIDNNIAKVKETGQRTYFIQEQANLQTRINTLAESLKSEVAPRYDTIVASHADIRQLLALIQGHKESPGDRAKLSAQIENLKNETRAFLNAATKYTEVFTKIKSDQAALHTSITGKAPSEAEAITPRLT